LPRPNWSRPLPRALTIPTIMDLVTLADARTLLGHLPKETRARDTWQPASQQQKTPIGCASYNGARGSSGTIVDDRNAAL
jgi:hypothetical protein